MIPQVEHFIFWGYLLAIFFLELLVYDSFIQPTNNHRNTFDFGLVIQKIDLDVVTGKEYRGRWTALS